MIFPDIIRDIQKVSPSFTSTPVAALCPVSEEKKLSPVFTQNTERTRRRIRIASRANIVSQCASEFRERALESSNER
jgi:hypothetical protein